MAAVRAYSVATGPAVEILGRTSSYAVGDLADPASLRELAI
jgi:hypothetical protein